MRPFVQMPMVNSTDILWGRRMSSSGSAAGGVESKRSRKSNSYMLKLSDPLYKKLTGL